MNNVNNSKFGEWGEAAAARYLQGKGWTILERRVRFREGEIDLIAEAQGELYFVEVKARRGLKFGAVVEALTPEKTRRLRRAIWRWREASGDHRPGWLYFLGIFLSRSGALTVEEHLVE